MSKLSKVDYGELVELCKPIAKYLRENGHPHMSVNIDSSCIRIGEDICGCPVDFDKNDKKGE